VRQLGGVLGIAATVAVFGSRGGFTSPGDFVAGFRPALLTAAGLSMLGAVAGLALPHRRVRQPNVEAPEDDPEHTNQDDNQDNNEMEETAA
jgi:hypothetical protein